MTPSGNAPASAGARSVSGHISSIVKEFVPLIRKAIAYTGLLGIVAEELYWCGSMIIAGMIIWSGLIHLYKMVLLHSLKRRTTVELGGNRESGLDYTWYSLWILSFSVRTHRRVRWEQDGMFVTQFNISFYWPTLLALTGVCLITYWHVVIIRIPIYEKFQIIDSQRLHFSY